MAALSLFPAFLYAANLVFFLVGLYVYVSLIRQIRARKAPAEDSPQPGRMFGFPEAIFAAVLMSLLLLNLAMAAAVPAAKLTPGDLVANLVITVVVLLILVGFLMLRRVNIDELAGFSRIGIVRAVATGGALLLLAYPLLNIADAITQRLIGDGSSRQNIVELFSGSRTMEERIMIIVLAVAIAPIAEEFVFRFFLYGVLRRYFGRFAGLAINSVLFAAVHQHLPAFGVLVVLGSCFTLAYEWSGSILVPMTMHSLFNSLSLILLAFPQISQQ